MAVNFFFNGGEIHITLAEFEKPMQVSLRRANCFLFFQRALGKTGNLPTPGKGRLGRERPFERAFGTTSE